MKKLFFTLLSIIGIIIIGIMVFTIPKNPFQIIPSLSTITSDNPIWLDIIIVGWSGYLITLYGIYSHLEIGGDSEEV